jgi:outer membrane protein
LKNTQLIANIIFGIALAVLFFLHFSGQSNTNQKESIVSPKIELKSSKLVYINTDSLWENYEYVKEIKKTLLNQRNQAEAEFAQKYQALANEEQNFREIAQRLSEEEGIKQQQELLLKEQKLGEFRDQMQERLMKSEQDKNEQITKNITDYLKIAYNNTPYNYILGYTRGGGILFAHDSLDITNEVISGLNANHNKKKDKK